MAEKIKSSDEPSIEEILDSIRQIISEDDNAKADEGDDIADADAVDDIFGEDSSDDATLEDFDEPLPEEEIFELKDRVDPDPELVKVPPPVDIPEEVPVVKKEKVPFEVDLIDETDKNDPEPVVEKAVTPPPVAPKPAVDDMPAGDSILTAAAENAAFSAIAELARRTAIEHNGVTIEEIVRSELKPLLRGWLDKNLPVVIERLVREELERVSKRVLED